jgi:hypothetical protein
MMCSIDTIICWIATVEEAMLLQHTFHSSSQRSAQYLAKFLGHPTKSPTPPKQHTYGQPQNQ